MDAKKINPKRFNDAMETLLVKNIKLAESPQHKSSFKYSIPVASDEEEKKSS